MVVSVANVCSRTILLSIFNIPLHSPISNIPFKPQSWHPTICCYCCCCCSSTVIPGRPSSPTLGFNTLWQQPDTCKLSKMPIIAMNANLLIKLGGMVDRWMDVSSGEDVWCGIPVEVSVADNESHKFFYGFVSPMFIHCKIAAKVIAITRLLSPMACW